MRKSILLTTVFTAVVAIALPFTGQGASSFAASTVPLAANSSSSQTGTVSTTATVITAVSAAAIAAAPKAAAISEHVAQKPVPPPPPVAAAPSAGAPAVQTIVVRGANGTTHVVRRALSGGGGAAAAAGPAAGASCPGNVGGATGGANGATVAGGIGTTTAGDLSSFAFQMNAIRVANCLPPVPLANYRYDSCMEARLIWIAQDPSPDPASAWGHKGTVRSDGVPEPPDCDGNLAGGYGNSGATVAQKWWDSLDHRASLYRPSYTGSTANVCILFAMVHGGVPNDGYAFTRAAARWVSC